MSNKNLALQRLRDPRPKKSQRHILFHYRVLVALRFVVAIFGGYLLASVTAKCLSLSPILPEASMVLAATMLAFVLHVLVVIWVFLVHSLLNVCLGIFMSTLVVYVVYIVLSGG